MNSPPTLEALTEQLTRIASARGCDPKQVTLTSVSTASLLLGLEAGYSPMLAAIANHVDTVGLVVQQWDWWQQSFPFLRGHLEPITGWLNHPGAGQRETLVKQLQLLSTIDLPQMAEQPAIAGDLLGQVLTLLSAPGDRSARGAFYTPPSLAAVIAQMGESVAPSDRILDACCGGGGLAVAAVRQLRASGKVPELRQWVLQDIDPYAVAIAGIAMSIHGIRTVRLTCADSLAIDDRQPAGTTA